MNDESAYDRRTAYLQYKLAQRAVVAADQVAHELIVQRGSSSLQVILVRAKKDAAVALSALVEADPGDARAVARLQAKVQMFRDMVKYIAEAISEGDSARHELDEADKADIAELVTEFEEPDDT